MGEDAQGTIGDEETGHVEHASPDSGVETKGTRQRLEEVAEWEGEIELLPFQHWAGDGSVFLLLLLSTPKCIMCESNSISLMRHDIE